MITPTVGRIVWFHADSDLARRLQPEAAIVVYVWNSRLVNLTVFGENGIPRPCTSVMLLQDDDPIPEPGIWYAQWMPYQKGQAAKTEELEKKQFVPAHEKSLFPG